MRIRDLLRFTSLLVAIASAAGIATLGCDGIQEGILERGLRANMGKARTDLLEDGALHVVLCGTGSPLPDPDRAGPCTAVMAADQLYIVDTGLGSWENLQLWKIPPRVSGILLTHFHSDHIGALGETIFGGWALGGRAKPVDIYGPPGVSRVVNGFLEAYALDRSYRIAHHGTEVMPPRGGLATAHTIVVPAPGSSTLVHEQDGLRISAFVVDHAPVRPAIGYRFDYAGRSVVVSGDTAKSDSLAKNAKGVDLLVHEALAANLIGRASQVAKDIGLERLSKITSDVLDYHTTPAEAKEIADAAGVRLLVTTHNVPPLRNALIRRLFTQGVDTTNMLVGEDGMHFRLPPGSAAIEQDELTD